MVVRNVVRSPVRAVVQSVFGEGESFHPFQLFRSGAQGAWYDPSDFSTLYQDAAGTTPVTAVEQPVRLMLDRSRGLVLGSEQRSTGAAGLQGTATAATFSTTTFEGSASRVDVINQSFVVFSGFTPNVLVRITVECLTGNVLIRASTLTNPGGSAAIIAAGQTKTSFIQATATGTMGVASTSNGTTSTFIVHSVRELPGNHAVAPNDASRPVLRARYNLLTRTEEFDDAAWSPNAASVTANAAVAPDGTTTAHLLTADGTSTTHFIRPGTGSWANGGTFTETVYIKRNTANFAHLLLEGHNAYLQFSLTDGSVTFTSAGTATNTAFSVTDAGNGWYRARLTATNTTGTTMRVRYYVLNASSNTSSPSETTTASMYLWGASLLTAADHAATGGAYQRVGAATDYDTGPPWRPYLAFDGSDDSMSTSSIDFSGTDKMTVFAGVSKLSDAALGMLAELSVNAGTENGSFFLAAPRTTTTADFGFRSTGTTLRDATSAASYSAPTTRVLTGIGDISGDVATLRVNGVQAATSASDQGTGNYANAPLFIGRRNNTSFPFNGRLYGLTVLGRTATAPELTAMEIWIAGKTGVSL